MTAQATINQVSPAFVAWTTAPYAPFAENLPATPAGQEDRLSRAAAILDKIRSSASPARLVADYLDEFDQLLPDLVELNIRQAVEEGRPALAQELKTLKSGFCPELVLPPLPFAEVRAQTEPAGFHGKVLLSSTSEYESPRMEHLQEVLKRQGCQVVNPDGQPITKENTPDVAVFSNPHLNPDLLEQMAVLSARGVPILLDLDHPDLFFIADRMIPKLHHDLRPHPSWERHSPWRVTFRAKNRRSRARPGRCRRRCARRPAGC